jgi:hypothetical protein
MTPPRSHRILCVAALSAFAAFAVACNGGSSDAATKPGGSSSDAIQIATLTPAAENTRPTAETASPSPQASATPESVPESPTPQPPSVIPTGLAFQPPQLRQGGYSVVYLYEPALNATVYFGGLQYPMLPDGDRWWALVGIGAFAEPGLAPLTVDYTPTDGGNTISLAQSIEITDFDYPVENINLDPQTSELLNPDTVNNELAVRAGIFSAYTPAKTWSGAFLPPAGGPYSSPYGIARSYNNGPVSSYHHGTDFLGDEGDPVYAAADGVVAFADRLDVRGNTIYIDHGASLISGYHHLSAINVTDGETVSTGQLIGAIGATGLVTGPHLHWEIIIHGVEIDGKLWLESGAIGP